MKARSFEIVNPPRAERAVLVGNAYPGVFLVVKEREISLVVEFYAKRLQILE